MNSLLSCDEVFDVLTRGPYSAGPAGDSRVDLHLQACHSCRDLAEALRPAVNLFHESLSQDEEAELPAYRGAGASSASDLYLPDEGQRRHLVELGHVVAGALIGLAACFVVSLAVKADPWSLSAKSGASMPSWNSLARDAQPVSQVAALGIPLSCLPAQGNPSGGSPGQSIDEVGPLSDQAPLTAVSANLDCCTRCHRAGGTSLLSETARGKLALACAACHRAPMAG